MAKIKIKNSVTAGSAPSGLSFGEMAVNITDKKIFIGNAVEGVVTLHDQNAIVTSINGSTGAITNVARINEGNTFTVRQVMNAGATMTALYVANGITLNGTRFELKSNSNPVIIGQNASTTNLKLTATNTSALLPLDPFINFIGGDTDISTDSVIFLDSGSIISGLGRVDINTNILGITGNQSLRGTLSVTGLGTFNTGITAAGATFSGKVYSDSGYAITSGAINTQTSTYTLVSADNGKVITMNSATGITLAVPTGLPVGFNTTVISLGTGLVGISAASGVTLNSFESKLRIAGQHAAASIISYSSNIFNVAGGLTA